MPSTLPAGFVLDQEGPPEGFVLDQPAPPTQATPAPAPIERPSGLIRRVVGDTAVDLGKGVVGFGEAAVGLGNLVSGGYVGKGLEAIGYDPQTTKKMLEEGYTHERVAANKAVSDAKGFVGTAKALIQNPSSLIGSAVESAPLMLGGGAVARGGAALLGRAGSIAAPGIGGQLAAIPATTAGRIGLAAAGEGLVGAGSAAEGIRQQSDDGLLSAKQTGAALASGAGTAALSALGGKVAQKLGIGDIDVALAGGAKAAGEAPKNILRRTIEGIVSEGLLEELPQSMQEQMWQNVATDKPLMEGVPEAAAAGALAGGLMGGGFSALSKPDVRPQPAPNAADKSAGTAGQVPAADTSEPLSGVAAPLSGDIPIQPQTPAAQMAANMRMEAQVQRANAKTVLGRAAADATDMQADAVQAADPFDLSDMGATESGAPPVDGFTRLGAIAQSLNLDPEAIVAAARADVGDDPRYSLDGLDDRILASYAQSLAPTVQPAQAQDGFPSEGAGSAQPTPVQAPSVEAQSGQANPVEGGGLAVESPVAAGDEPAIASVPAAGAQAQGVNPDAPGATLKNGFKRGEEPGKRYRVSSSNMGVALEKRNDKSGSASTFFIGKDGALIGGDTIARNNASSADRLWTPPSDEARVEAESILDEMGKLQLSDPKRAELKDRLRDVVTGVVRPTQAAPALPATSGQAPQAASQQSVADQSQAASLPAIAQEAGGQDRQGDQAGLGSPAPDAGTPQAETKTSLGPSPQGTPVEVGGQPSAAVDPASPKGRRAAMEASVPADILAARDAATERLNAASAAMQQFPAGNMGLTPDAVKATPEWRAAKIELDRATVAARNANAAVVKASKVAKPKANPKANNPESLHNGWATRNAELGERYAAAKKALDAAEKPLREARYADNDRLPPGYKTIPYPARDMPEGVALQDDEGNDIAYPLTPREAADRAWKESGRTDRFTNSDAREQASAAQLAALRAEVKAAQDAWDANGKSPMGPTWEAERRAKVGAEQKARDTAAKAARTRAENKAKKPRSQMTSKELKAAEAENGVSLPALVRAPLIAWKDAEKRLRRAQRQEPSEVEAATDDRIGAVVAFQDAAKAAGLSQPQMDAAERFARQTQTEVENGAKAATPVFDDGVSASFDQSVLGGVPQASIELTNAQGRVPMEMVADVQGATGFTAQTMSAGSGVAKFAGKEKLGAWQLMDSPSWRESRHIDVGIAEDGAATVKVTIDNKRTGENISSETRTEASGVTANNWTDATVAFLNRLKAPVATASGQAIESALAAYGYSLKDGEIVAPSGKASGATVKVVKGRARVSDKKGNKLWTGTPANVGKFLEAYWFAKKSDATTPQPSPAKTDSKPTAQAASEPAAKIDDFGAKLEGARKFLPPGLKDAVSDDDLASLPLSKIWPADAHLEIEDPTMAAMAFTARDQIPAKPRTAYKVKQWAEKVKMFRELMRMFTDESLPDMIKRAEAKGFHSLVSDFFPRVQLLAQLPRETWKRVEKVGHYPNARRLKTEEELKRDGFVAELRAGSTTYYDYFKVDPKTGKRSDRIVPWGATSSLHDEMFTPAPHSTVTIDGKTTTFDVPAIGPDEVQAIKELLGEAAPQKSGLTGKDFEIRVPRGSKTAFINRNGDAAYRRLKEFAGDDAVKQAQAYLKDNVPALAEAWEGVKARDNVTKGDVRRDENAERVGENRRDGKDVTPEMFEQAFGFRGVQFGNWVAQGKDAKGRQGLLNETYDALLDLSDLLGIPSKAISLEGSLGLSLGARGHGKASAHFEPDTLVINLTKTRGSGTLAHEWFHALDNYFARKRVGGQASSYQQGGRENNYITYKPEPMLRSLKGFGTMTRAEVERRHRLHPSTGAYRPENWEPSPNHKEGVRPVVEKAFAELVSALNESPMAKRSADIDGVKVRGGTISSDGYWSRIIERGARSFENYVITKMAQRGWTNDFLANIRDWAQWQATGKNADRYPYLRQEEEGPIVESFDKLFATIEARETDTGIALESVEEEPFYSATLRAVTEAKNAPKKGNAEQWKGWLDGAQRRGEFKQAERDWLGLDAWLNKQEKPVTRDQLADYVRANEVQVQDVTLEAHDEMDGMTRAPRSGVKFAQYQLPGGQNYRELLLTLPTKPSTSLADYTQQYRERFPTSRADDDMIRQYWQDGNGLPNGPGLTAKADAAVYKSSHFDQPNILAHVRFNERTDADGKKVLFIEEIQSDWGQSIRKQGIAPKPEVIEQDGKFMVRDNATGEFASSELGPMTFSERRFAQQQAESMKGRGLPDMPFKGTDEWAMLAFKRMVREAVDKGFDRIAWTTGEQQAERYSLAKHVRDIVVSRHDLPAPDSRTVVINMAGGGNAIHLSVNADGVIDAGQRDLRGKPLDEVVGKEAADKIMRVQDSETIREFEGGEGMQGFYDNILPLAVGKWAKKFGGKVGQTTIDVQGQGLREKWLYEGPTRTADEIEAAAHNDSHPAAIQFQLREAAQLMRGGASFQSATDVLSISAARVLGGDMVPLKSVEAKQHALDLTPAMRETVLGGLPLFQMEKSARQDSRPQPQRAGSSLPNNDAELRIIAREFSQADGMADADRLGLRKAVNAALGGYPPVNVTYLRGEEGLDGIAKPGYVKRLQDQRASRDSKARTAGLYLRASETVDGKPRVVLFTDVANTPIKAMFTAAHEIAGHHGLRSLLGLKLNTTLARAYQNPTVKAVADAIYKSRGIDANVAKGRYTAKEGRLLAIEEALADLAAANRLGRYEEIESRHGVTVPLTQQKGLKATIARIVEAIKSIFRAKNVRFTDAQVHSLLEASWKAAQDRSASFTSINADGTLEQVVFHGTPHKVDRFSLNKIGTGEGAQAYGWGLYYASLREIADYYRKTLSNRGSIDTAENIARKMFPGQNHGNIGGLIAQAATLDLDARMQQNRNASIRGLDTKQLQEAIDQFKRETSGELYRVDIPEDSDLLDWDKPLSEQPEKVREAIERGGRYNDGLRMALGRNLNAAATGQSIYQALSRQLGGPQKASERLLDLGVVGLRYLDGNSRNPFPFDVQVFDKSGTLLKFEKARSRAAADAMVADAEASGHTAKVIERPVEAGSANYVIWDESAIGQPQSALESVSDDTRDTYNARIDALFNGDKAALKGVRILDRSDVLGMMGLGEGPMNIAEGKVIEGRYNHKLTAADWKKVPGWLENPALVFQSEQGDGSRLVFIAPETVGGEIVRMIVQPNAKNGADVHLLVNAYDAAGGNPLLRWAQDDLLRYVDTKKSPALAARSGRRLPGLADKPRGSAQTILTQKDLGKYRAEAGQAAVIGTPSSALESTEDQTQSEAFKRWFGDSKVVDADGKPLVVYHGTNKDFSKFKDGPVWFHTDPQQAFASGEGANVMPAYVKIERPIRRSGYFGMEDFSDPARFKFFDKAAGQWVTPDGVIGDNGVVVAFSPKQIKSATGNRGTFDPNEGSILESVEDGSVSSALAGAMGNVRNVKLPAGYMLADFLNGQQTKALSWWDKSVGTMYHLAQRSPLFKDVFDRVQNMVADVSHYANAAMDLAPDVLPKFDSMRDAMKKKPMSAADAKKVSAAVFDGTLKWSRDINGDIIPAGGDDKAGVVWTDDELASRFGMDERQRGLYRQVRQSIDKSLDDTAATQMLRIMGADAAWVREEVLQAPTARQAANIIQRHIGDMLAKRFGLTADGRESSLEETAKRVMEVAAQVDKLKNRGYAPLSRFGRYTVYKDGENPIFLMFETQREANRAARKLSMIHVGVRQGTMSQEQFKLFKGITPETLELFGEMLGLDATGSDQDDLIFQTFIKAAKSNRSALKRLIHREGVAGYSEDVPRVLASFLYSNARLAATNLHAPDIQEAIQAIPKEQGELKDAAIRLNEYIINPDDAGAFLSSFNFAQFLGGSIASALVNMTQPLTMSFPWLSQYGGAWNAAKTLAAASKLAVTQGTTGNHLLDEALKRADADGHTQPQEVHQLQAYAGGKGVLRSGDGTKAGDAAASAYNAKARIMLAWGLPFSLAEQFNRRATFIAAWNTAKEQGMADPYGFAVQAVQATQGIYNKANKPQWSRNAIGGMAFTFKQYSINYVEMLHRMWVHGGKDGKQGVLLAAAVMFLLSGAGGLPGADDLDDLLDGLMQRLGYNFSSKQAREQFFANLIGEQGAKFMEHGLSAVPGMPIDVSGRLGMGNLLPSTGLLVRKENHASDIAEIAGPTGDIVKRGFQAAGQLAEGKVGASIMSLAPRAVSNAWKGVEMASTGEYRDTRGRKVLDTTMGEAAAKAIGFQPAAVAKVQQASGKAYDLLGNYRVVAADIADRWAKGIHEGDPDAAAQAQQDLADWNAKNPDMPIRISRGAIQRRIFNLRLDRRQRLAKTTPKAVRSQIESLLDSGSMSAMSRRARRNLEAEDDETD